MKGIYEFFANFGRMGQMSGTFIAEKSEVEAACEKTAYFDEVLGKHSYIELDLSPEHITLKTDDQAFIAKFEEILGEGYSTGINPLEHIPESEL